jgi:hypothetical protein
MFIICSNCLIAGESLKDEAIVEFKKENYAKAIQLMRQAAEKDSSNAEIYYYLGFFNHYLANDSRPLEGYDYEMSEKIFGYLKKAVELQPKFGNARYFYGAECSVNAFRAMRDRNADELRRFYKKAFDIGAYPPWLLEYGRNLLGSCDSNAILFCGGNADFDVCSYLQLHEQKRTDLTLAPIGYIDRPWYVKFLKDGLPGAVRPMPIALTDNEIMDIHPYKWRAQTIEIKLSEDVRKRFSVDSAATLTIAPDLSSGRLHSKIKGEKAAQRTYLSPQKAVLLHILETNAWRRPVFISKNSNSYFFAGLGNNLREHTLALEVMPFETTPQTNIDAESMEKLLLDYENLKSMRSVFYYDIPRISPILTNYLSAAYDLAQHHVFNGNKEKAKEIIKIAKKYLAIGHIGKYETKILKAMEGLIQNK